MERNDVAKDLGFFLAGAVAGGVVAALATPYSGHKMRRILRYKVEDGRERISDSASGMVRECSRLCGRGAKFFTGSSLLATAAGLFQRARGYQR